MDSLCSHSVVYRASQRMSLELGGNAPLIVFQDADLEQAAAAAVGSALRNAGQTCICANRVFVHEAVHDAFAGERFSDSIYCC
jgi:succinate-semialdehyde dehydrogenase/glutarate-semialdehyde dehydrogenase